VKRGGGKPLPARAGTGLDPEVEKRLAAEAEASFDPATLNDRPSLSVDRR